MVPSTYEDGTLYNVLPSGNKAPDETGSHNGYDQTRADFTFSRGSNLAATRVNSDGLIEKGRENLLLQSNQFDTTWGKSNVTLTSGHEGYDGTNNAWKLIQTTTAGYHFISQSVTSSSLMTLSIYAKAGEYSALSFYQNNASESSVASTFNLSNGTWTTKNHIAKSTDVGNGWYRLEIVTKDSGTDAYRFYVNQTTQQSEAGDGTSGIYIQNAQLEKGLVATDYIETGSTTAQAGILEDMPRINYDANGENGALLLESSRTNLITNSEYFGASGWNLDGGVQSITTNYGNSPEGVKNAARLQLDKTGTTYSRLYFDAGSLGQATISVYMKSNTSQTQNVGLRYDDTGVNCEVTTEWKRFDLTATSTTVSRFQILLFDSIVGNDESADILIYGAQMESASYPSSYVPTYGSAVTRSADSCTNTSATSVIGQTEGTIYWEGVINGAENNYSNLITSERSTATGFSVLYKKSGSQFQCAVFDGSTKGQCNGGSVVIGQKHKLAYAYKSGDFALYVDGVQVATSTQTWTPPSTIDELYLADPITFFGYKEANQHSQAIVFKERLSNSELADLTS